MTGSAKLESGLDATGTREGWICVGLCLALLSSLFISPLRAQTTLAVGDVQVLGVTSDANDSFAFVIWRDLAAGTVIRFMDHSFTNAGNGVLGTENDMSLTFTTALSAGTVVRVEDTGTTLVNGGSFTGTKSGSLSGISNDGDQVFIYQGTAMGSGTNFSGRTLLHGFNIADTNWIASGSASSNISYLPTAINAISANFDSGNFDNAGYTGTRTGLTTATYRAAVSNLENYTQNNTRFDLGTTGFTLNTATELHWDANGTTTGNGGGGTWDATTQSRFKNGTNGTTYLRWIDSSTGNDHTAIFGGTAGTVSVAAGGVVASGMRFTVDGYVLQNQTITLTGSTPTIETMAGSATIASSIAGSAGLSKSGPGTLVLTADNAYSGETNVNAGTLLVEGDHSAATGAVEVASGATLGGSGTIGGSTSVLAGGSITGGSDGTVGELTFAADLTTTPGSTWLIDLVEISDGSSDHLDATGQSLSIGGSILDLNLIGGGFTVGHTYTIATYGNLSGTFNGLSEGAILSNYRIHYGSGTNSSITLTAVPEPGTLALLGTAFGGGWLLRRRRKNS